jgi:hypothetical protein
VAKERLGLLSFSKISSLPHDANNRKLKAAPMIFAVLDDFFIVIICLVVKDCTANETGECSTHPYGELFTSIQTVYTIVQTVHAQSPLRDFIMYMAAFWDDNEAGWLDLERSGGCVFWMVPVILDLLAVNKLSRCEAKCLFKARGKIGKLVETDSIGNFGDIHFPCP